MGSAIPSCRSNDISIKPFLWRPVLFHVSQSIRHFFSIAILTPFTYLRTTDNWVPCFVAPFDFCHIALFTMFVNKDLVSRRGPYPCCLSSRPACRSSTAIGESMRAVTCLFRARLGVLGGAMNPLLRTTRPLEVAGFWINYCLPKNRFHHGIFLSVAL